MATVTADIVVVAAAAAVAAVMTAVLMTAAVVLVAVAITATIMEAEEVRLERAFDVDAGMAGGGQSRAVSLRGGGGQLEDRPGDVQDMEDVDPARRPRVVLVGGDNGRDYYPQEYLGEGEGTEGEGLRQNQKWGRRRLRRLAFSSSKRRTAAHYAGVEDEKRVKRIMAQDKQTAARRKEKRRKKAAGGGGRNDACLNHWNALQHRERERLREMTAGDRGREGGGGKGGGGEGGGSGGKGKGGHAIVDLTGGGGGGVCQDPPMSGAPPKGVGVKVAEDDDGYDSADDDAPLVPAQMPVEGEAGRRAGGWEDLLDGGGSDSTRDGGGSDSEESTTPQLREPPPVDSRGYAHHTASMGGAEGGYEGSFAQRQATYDASGVSMGDAYGFASLEGGFGGSW
jgi:hypothetical protein